MPPWAYGADIFISFNHFSQVSASTFTPSPSPSTECAPADRSLIVCCKKGSLFAAVLSSPLSVFLPVSLSPRFIMKKKLRSGHGASTPASLRGSGSRFTSICIWGIPGASPSSPQPLSHRDYCYLPALEEMGTHKQKRSFARTWQELRKPSQLFGTGYGTVCLFNPTG